jgi:hypothetical protein
MPHRHALRPPTEVLTSGFDPSLSVGSARPALFRCSTYVFSSPEAAERAFCILLKPPELAEFSPKFYAAMGTIQLI